MLQHEGIEKPPLGNGGYGAPVPVGQTVELELTERKVGAVLIGA